MGPNTSLPPDVGAFNWLWGYFMPLGLLLLIWGGLTPRKARRVTPLAAFSLAVALLGYWAVGFAFHMGGAFAVNPDDPTLQGLQLLFSVVPGDAGWGLVGLAGFFLSGDAITSTAFALFLAYVPVVVTAVLLVTLALATARRWVMVMAGGLMGTVILPVAACWMWGSGWLAHLGETMGLGFGFVDFGGSTLIFWLPGMVVLPVLLLSPRDEAPVAPPPLPNHFPLFSNLGALLMGIGWLGWSLSQPFHLSGTVLDWHRTAVNVLIGMAGAVVTSQLYAWLVTGEPAALMAAQGLCAGWGAVLAAAPFIPPWGALVVGLLAGLLFPLLHYVIHTRIKLQDGIVVLALALTSGPLGVLTVALLGDGRWGQGWQGIGITPEGNAAGPGIAGIFVSGNTGQLSAQVVGLLAVGLWGLLWGVILGVIANPRRVGRLARRATSRISAVDTPRAEALENASEEGASDEGASDEVASDEVASEGGETAAPDVIIPEVVAAGVSKEQLGGTPDASSSDGIITEATDPTTSGDGAEAEAGIVEPASEETVKASTS